MRLFSVILLLPFPLQIIIVVVIITNLYVTYLKFMKYIQRFYNSQTIYDLLSLITIAVVK